MLSSMKSMNVVTAWTTWGRCAPCHTTARRRRPRDGARSSAPSTVRVTSAVQEEVIQLAHGDRRGKMIRECCQSDARHVPIAEGKVRRTVLHRGRESATHPAQPRPRPRLRPAQLANVPEPAREPVITIPPSSGTAPEFELEDCQLATGQIIVFASRANGLGSQNSNKSVPPINSKSSAPLPGSFNCAVMSMTSTLKPAWVRREPLAAQHQVVPQ